MLQQLVNWLRADPANGPRSQSARAFGQTSIGRTVSRTGLLLKRQLWIWPIIAVLILSVLGWWVSSAIRRTMSENLHSELQTLLNVERSMLQKWLEIQEDSATTIANDPQVRKIILEILATESAASDSTKVVDEIAALRAETELHSRLERELEAAITSHDFAGYVVASKSRTVVAAYTRELIGTNVEQYEDFLARSFEGAPTVSVPFPSQVMLKDSTGQLQSGMPTMFVTAPVRDEDLNVVAVMAFRIRPDQEFTTILQLGRNGATGETYAIDRNGLFLSHSRFDEELIMQGVLPDVPNATSILSLSARDPGVDMTTGRRPGTRRSEMPLTQTATSAIAQASGVDVEGSRDYRGVTVVSAWDWLTDYEMGIITQMDHAEAFGPLKILQRTFLTLYALLVLSSVAIFLFTLRVAKYQRLAQKSAIEAKQLGQYHLDSQIGAGAMGMVYKGHHAMLRRPTAIKLLNADRVNETTIARFEREVQITCKLNNPNTIAIYDYGRTPEGVFYYAMEYLDGINLQSLVERDGPQPEGRVIHILKQVCSSLNEAHSLALVHRDIKPANIMLNRRGGEPDVIKVLDFGLVQAIDEARQSKEAAGIAGTPLYLSPEAIQTPAMVDARSDLYAVGAVGYFLLTGGPVFQAQSLVELCQQHVDRHPDLPSKRLRKPVSVELENALLACLEKSREKRPQTARELIDLLDQVPTARSWTRNDAVAWWNRHDRATAGGSSVSQGFDLKDAELSGGERFSQHDSASGFDAKRSNPVFDVTIESGEHPT
jgi:serine/threonine protein kinase